MIVAEKSHDTQISGSFQSSQFAFHVNAKAYKLLFSNIYTHKVQAIVREYSTNAYDAHVEAGIKDRPFNVHLPTQYEPVFKVRDFGKGLNPTEVKEVFASFFYSTKSNSNDFVGCLGLGSCSAFSLVKQFVVKSYQNGTVSTYSCYIADDGCPNVSPLTSEDTTEENGLEVIVNIASKDATFQNEAVRVYQWFSVKPNINLKAVSDKISDIKWDFKGEGYGFNTEYGTTFAVMGNVAYPIPNSITYNNRSYSINAEGFINFEIGELEFDPGREKLSLDEKTLKNVVKRWTEVSDKMGFELISHIQKIDTPLGRAREQHNLNRGYLNVFLRDSDQFNMPKRKDEVIRYMGSRDNKIDTTNTFPVSSNCRYFKYEGDYKPSRIKAYSRSNSVTVVLLTQEQIDFYGLAPTEYEDISVIPAVKGSPKSKPIKVKTFCTYGGLVEATVDVSEPFLYVEMERGKPLMTYNEINEYKLFLKDQGVDTGVVYAIATSAPKKLLKSGTKFLDFVKKNAKFPETATLNEPVNLHMLKHFDSRFKSFKIDKHAHIYRRFGVRHDNKLDVLSQRYEETYPLLKVIGRLFGQFSYPSTTDLEILKGIIHELH